MTMILETITNNNLQSAIDIAKQIFPYEIHADGFWPEVAYKMSIEEKDPYFKYYLATERGSIIGITGHYKEDDGMWLGWFGVIPARRRNGYGSALLLESTKVIANLGFNKLKLYSGDREEERAAHRLYKKHGFTQIKTGQVDGLPVLFFEASLPLQTLK